MKELTVAGLISGVGNILGFQQAGFTPIWFYDFRKHIIKCKNPIKKMFPTMELNFTNPLAFKDKVPTVIVASPPCGQLSALGVKREDRAQLANLPIEKFDFIIALEQILSYNSDFIVVEYLNSISKYFIFDYEKITHIVSGNVYYFPKDYRVQIVRWEAVNYGMGQSRKRFSLILSKKKFDFVYIIRTLKGERPRTLGDELRAVEAERKRRKDLGLGPIPNDDNLDKPLTERGLKFLKLEIGESLYKSGMNNRVLDPDTLCTCITSHLTRHINPFSKRLLNTRESAQIQGFPFDFDFHTHNTTALDLIGRSIPPPVTKHIGEAIKKSIIEYYSTNKED